MIQDLNRHNRNERMLTQALDYDVFVFKVRAIRETGLGLIATSLIFIVLFTLILVPSFLLSERLLDLLIPVVGDVDEGVRLAVWGTFSAVGTWLLYLKVRTIFLNKRAAKILGEDYRKVCSVGELPKDPNSLQAILHRAKRRAIHKGLRGL